ncbi:MAG: anaerobic ribonucleoside-triphosphate reductase activating protein [Hespellia sp.]|nr:anaerobic ribonucleoside-triphosphate reductase activating protein [Hespellia sp.]
MNIQGLQKLTLLDYPEQVACTIFTAGCNFRCPFCHNAPLVTHVDLSCNIPEEETLAFLKKRQGILDAVCISGGEPCLQPDLVAFIKSVKELGYKVKLDTNGSFPEKLKELTEAGLLDYVAMDIKNSIRKYPETIGIEGYDTKRVEESVDYLMSGVVPFEFRTTVVREFHKKDDFKDISRWIAGDELYFLQSFEDSGDLICEGLRGYNKDIMQQAADIVREQVPNVKLRGV